VLIVAFGLEPEVTDTDAVMEGQVKAPVPTQ